ncbi:uncharacterized protein EAF01_009841 [Botrytis porri]|uniref:uncharacterized protein n=1 Tax=Botrytis porri TaxID=87229 RepID=UPI001902053D|nr:uncharacterized protein EAF01_009841 [Botrytis porri]KAF7894390.1 hypothetical protein EAF01_009841 [Botrytis porri]
MNNHSQEDLKEARDFIDDLQRQNGGIKKEHEEILERELPEVLQTIKNMLRKLGVSTQMFALFIVNGDFVLPESNRTLLTFCTLAEQLYQKSTRFIYEIIQNAEDNRYTASNKLPFLSFTLHSDRLIIDSNEDGFTRKDINATCSIGESTKACVRGYIGEKGIGFKSVFNVAHKVHIQPGRYSLAFEYSKEDSKDCGLGMVTPMNETPHELPDDRRVVNLPANSARAKILEAEVILAFPINEDHVSDIEEQDVFAFLPLKKTGYKVGQAGRCTIVNTEANLNDKFLIQCDFITKASREDIVDSAWNRQLLEEVVATFRSAINDPNGFLEYNALRYSWIRYIPANAITDEFWGLLQPRLFNRLCSNTIAGTTAYVSEPYDPSDIPILEKMKAKRLNTGEFLQRLDEDLVGIHDSRMKTTPLSSLWHTRMSNLLISMSQDDSNKMKIQKLNIIPLDSGTWARPLNASIIFPTSGGVDIPKDLPLNLVDGKALENTSREKLFSQLGVAECSPERMFPLIEQRYNFPTRKIDSVSDIKFLFWHHEKLPAYYSIFMWLWNGECSLPHDTNVGDWIYCRESDHACTTIKIIGESIPLEMKNGSHVRYTGKSYYSPLEACGIRNRHTGIEWLRSLGIKETPQIRRRENPSDPKLSIGIQAHFKRPSEMYAWRVASRLGVVQ